VEYGGVPELDLACLMEMEPMNPRPHNTGPSERPVQDAKIVHRRCFIALFIALVVSGLVLGDLRVAVGASASESIPSVGGLAVQVNEGGPVPDASVLKFFLPPGQTVRDALGWHRVERSNGRYSVPETNWQLYKIVASVGGKNVVTLFGGNKIYGMRGDFEFPATREQIEGFANFAAWAVRHDGAETSNEHAANIPNLYAVTIWNEMNGAWHGSISDPKERQAAMAALLNAVVPRIRTANPSVHIAAGAFMGFPGLAHWFQQIGKNFRWETVDWLDIHPYLADRKEKPAEEWTRQMKLLRFGDPSHGIAPIKNPAYYSEWGGPTAMRYTRDHAGDPAASTYFEWFEKTIVRADPVPVAGGNYFTLVSSAKFPQQGLTMSSSLADRGQATTLGEAFQRRYTRMSD
jgi:hypothetical protein